MSPENRALESCVVTRGGGQQRKQQSKERAESPSQVGLSGQLSARRERDTHTWRCGGRGTGGLAVERTPQGSCRGSPGQTLLLLGSVFSPRSLGALLRGPWHRRWCGTREAWERPGAPPPSTRPLCVSITSARTRMASRHTGQAHVRCRIHHHSPKRRTSDGQEKPWAFAFGLSTRPPRASVLSSMRQGSTSESP